MTSAVVDPLGDATEDNAAAHKNKKRKQSLIQVLYSKLWAESIVPGSRSMRIARGT